MDDLGNEGRVSWLWSTCALSKDVLGDFSVHIGQTEITSGVIKRQALVI